MGLVILHKGEDILKLTSVWETTVRTSFTISNSLFLRSLGYHVIVSFRDFIRWVEEQTYYPTIKFFGNNDIIQITVNHTDSWFLMY